MSSGASSPSDGAEGGYDFAALAAAEERHFWFKQRRRVIANVVSDLVRDLEPGYKVLEMGCGTGGVLGTLERACARGLVIGMDQFAESLWHARDRSSCALVQGDVQQNPFGQRFDLVGMFDVIEHLPDDRPVLESVRELLSANGSLILTVPAHKSLWSYVDVLSQHYRRYDQRDLANSLEAAGYRVHFMSEFMMAAFPAMWASRRIAQLFGRGDGERDAASGAASHELRVVPGVNAAFNLLLRPEAWWIGRGRRVPLGTSLLAVARPC